jgi:hypothetical protein
MDVREVIECLTPKEWYCGLVLVYIASPSSIRSSISSMYRINFIFLSTYRDSPTVASGVRDNSSAKYSGSTRHRTGCTF